MRRSKRIRPSSKHPVAGVSSEEQCCPPDDLPIPAWHYEVLAERERLIREGKAKFLDFAEVCKELRNALP